MSSNQRPPALSLKRPQGSVSQLGTMEGASKYAPLTDIRTLLKDWTESLLQNCSKDRMLVISKQFLIPNTNLLTKKPLYHAVFYHMLTIQDCIQCGGNCDPTKHVFHCNEPPAYLPANIREARPISNITSPSRVSTISDSPVDTPVHEAPSTPLSEERPKVPTLVVVPPFLPRYISARLLGDGGILFHTAPPSRLSRRTRRE